MRSWPFTITKVLGVLVTLLLTLAFPAQAKKPLEESQLVAALKKGGYVIYLRHAATDRSKTDSKRDDLSDWTKQRLLSDRGRSQAAGIGAAMEALGISVSKVVSSPYCRCLATARLAFGKATASNDLAFSIGTEEQEAKRLGQALREMLGTIPPPGTNTVLVAHTANLKEAARIWPKPEGVAVIFKPLGNGKFEMVGKVKPEQWPEMARKMGAPVAVPKEMADTSVLCGTKAARRD